MCRVARLFLLLSLFIGTGTTAVAQSYPVKTIRIIVPFAPSGGNDFIARVIAQKLSESFGQQVIVDNRPGGGGIVGAELGVKAPPDGYTINLVGGSYPVNANIYKLSFDPLGDITPIIQISRGPFLLVVHPSLPAKTVKELVTLARAKPGEINYASHGVGGIGHLATELFQSMAGIKMVHVPYKGTGPALTETIAGETSVLMGSVAPTLPRVRDGRLRALAVTTAERIEAAPTIPTLAEAGVPGYEVILWHGLAGPKGLPPQIVERLNSVVNKSLQTPEMMKRLAGDGVAPAGGTPQQFLALIKRDIEMWNKVVRQGGIKAE